MDRGEVLEYFSRLKASVERVLATVKVVQRLQSDPESATLPTHIVSDLKNSAVILMFAQWQAVLARLARAVLFKELAEIKATGTHAAFCKFSARQIAVMNFLGKAAEEDVLEAAKDRREAAAARIKRLEDLTPSDWRVSLVQTELLQGFCKGKLATPLMYRLKEVMKVVSPTLDFPDVNRTWSVLLGLGYSLRNKVAHENESSVSEKPKGCVYNAAKVRWTRGGSGDRNVWATTETRPEGKQARFVAPSGSSLDFSMPQTKDDKLVVTLSDKSLRVFVEAMEGLLNELLDHYLPVVAAAGAGISESKAGEA